MFVVPKLEREIGICHYFKPWYILVPKL